MIFSLWTKYGALNSVDIFAAVKKGLLFLGHSVTENNPNADVDVIWSVLFRGRLAGNKAVWDRAQQNNKPVIVLEVGCLSRGHTWKVGLNGIERSSFVTISNGDTTRANKLELQLAPWRSTGDTILICTQNSKSLLWNNMPDLNTWTNDTIKSVRQYSNKPIVVRAHPRMPFKFRTLYTNVNYEWPKPAPIDFTNIWATINWTSGPGVDSIIAGVPAFTSQKSLAYPMSSDSFESIANPATPDRTKWFRELLYTEFTIPEIANGTPFNRIVKEIDKLL
jgi:hypothetical protein